MSKWVWARAKFLSTCAVCSKNQGLTDSWLGSLTRTVFPIVILHMYPSYYYYRERSYQRRSLLVPVFCLSDSLQIMSWILSSFDRVQSRSSRHEESSKYRFSMISCRLPNCLKTGRGCRCRLGELPPVSLVLPLLSALPCQLC